MENAVTITSPEDVLHCLNEFYGLIGNPITSDRQVALNEGLMKFMTQPSALVAAVTFLQSASAVFNPQSSLALHLYYLNVLDHHCTYQVQDLSLDRVEHILASLDGFTQNYFKESGASEAVLGKTLSLMWKFCKLVEPKERGLSSSLQYYQSMVNPSSPTCASPLVAGALLVCLEQITMEEETHRILNLHPTLQIKFRDTLHAILCHFLHSRVFPSTLLQEWRPVLLCSGKEENDAAVFMKVASQPLSAEQAERLSQFLVSLSNLLLIPILQQRFPDSDNLQSDSACLEYLTCVAVGLLHIQHEEVYDAAFLCCSKMASALELTQDSLMASFRLVHLNTCALRNRFTLGAGVAPLRVATAVRLGLTWWKNHAIHFQKAFLGGLWPLLELWLGLTENCVVAAGQMRSRGGALAYLLLLRTWDAHLTFLLDQSLATLPEETRSGQVREKLVNPLLHTFLVHIRTADLDAMMRCLFGEEDAGDEGEEEELEALRNEVLRPDTGDVWSPGVGLVLQAFFNMFSRVVELCTDHKWEYLLLITRMLFEEKLRLEQAASSSSPEVYRSLGHLAFGVAHLMPHYLQANFFLRETFEVLLSGYRCTLQALTNTATSRRSPCPQNDPHVQLLLATSKQLMVTMSTFHSSLTVVNLTELTLVLLERVEAHLQDSQRDPLTLDITVATFPLLKTFIVVMPPGSAFWSGALYLALRRLLLSGHLCRVPVVYDRASFTLYCALWRIWMTLPTANNTPPSSGVASRAHLMEFLQPLVALCTKENYVAWLVRLVKYVLENMGDLTPKQKSHLAVALQEAQFFTSLYMKFPCNTNPAGATSGSSTATVSEVLDVLQMVGVFIREMPLATSLDVVKELIHWQLLLFRSTMMERGRELSESTRNDLLEAALSSINMLFTYPSLMRTMFEAVLQFCLQDLAPFLADDAHALKVLNTFAALLRSNCQVFFCRRLSLLSENNIRDSDMASSDATNESHQCIRLTVRTEARPYLESLLRPFLEYLMDSEDLQGIAGCMQLLCELQRNCTLFSSNFACEVILPELLRALFSLRVRLQHCKILDETLSTLLFLVVSPHWTEVLDKVLPHFVQSQVVSLSSEQLQLLNTKLETLKSAYACKKNQDMVQDALAALFLTFVSFKVQTCDSL